jgi:N utilization substance protein A
LAIGRNGQNVRLASQLIGWQIDLYGSREWVELGADLSLFQESPEDEYETSDFSLAELSLAPETLGALGNAGYSTFLQIIDFDRAEFLAIEGLTEEAADKLLALIDELTVVADSSEPAAEPVAEAEAEQAEAEQPEPEAEADEVLAVAADGALADEPDQSDEAAETNDDDAVEA